MSERNPETWPEFVGEQRPRVTPPPDPRAKLVGRAAVKGQVEPPPRVKAVGRTAIKGSLDRTERTARNERVAPDVGRTALRGTRPAAPKEPERG